MAIPTVRTKCVQDWAALKTETWAQQAREEFVRQRRSEVMVRLRANKKQQMERLRDEREALEIEVKDRWSDLKRSIGTSSGDNDVERAMCRVSLESDLLRDENVKLHRKLQTYERFLSMALQALVSINALPERDTNPQTVHKVCKRPERAERKSHHDRGWRVFFSNGKPSFYFHPFSQEVFDAVINQNRPLFENPPAIPLVGTLFDWTVHRKPASADNSHVEYKRLTHRARGSLRNVNSKLSENTINLWTLLVTPPIWGQLLRTSANTQVLQQFDRDSHVLVTNIPGQVNTNTRYIHGARRLRATTKNGKRTITIFMIIVNSEANARNRAAEQPQHNVQRANKGGLFIQLTEVDKKTTDVH